MPGEQTADFLDMKEKSGSRQSWHWFSSSGIHLSFILAFPCDCLCVPAVAAVAPAPCVYSRQKELEDKRFKNTTHWLDFHLRSLLGSSA